MGMWVLIVALLVLAFLLLVAEMFVIGGVLGVMGGILVLVASGLGYYYYGATYGTLVLIVSVFISGIIIAVGIRWIRSSKAGKSLFLSDVMSQKDGYESADDTLDVYVGKSGVTLSELRPAGLAEIDGERLTVNTEGEYIDEQVPIEVVGVRYNQLIVRQKEA